MQSVLSWLLFRIPEQVLHQFQLHQFLCKHLLHHRRLLLHQLLPARKIGSLALALLAKPLGGVVAVTYARGLEVRKLSAGQRRRLALARLIAAPRALWLLDEPLSPLDSRWRETAGAVMRRHLDGGGLIVAAVHDPLPIDTRSVVVGNSR